MYKPDFYSVNWAASDRQGLHILCSHVKKNLPYYVYILIKKLILFWSYRKEQVFYKLHKMQDISKYVKAGWFWPVILLVAVAKFRKSSNKPKEVLKPTVMNQNTETQDLEKNKSKIMPQVIINNLRNQLKDLKS